MGEDKVMIAKKDRSDKISFKVRTKVRNSFSPNEYMKVVNPKDYNDLALLFEDLSVIFSAPIEKSFRKYMEKKGRGFPF